MQPPLPFLLSFSSLLPLVLLLLLLVSFVAAFVMKTSSERTKNQNKRKKRKNKTKLVAATRTRPRRAQTTVSMFVCLFVCQSHCTPYPPLLSSCPCLFVCQLSGQGRAAQGNKISNKMKWLQTLAVSRLRGHLATAGALPTCCTTCTAVQDMPDS